jgi:hypothetical protein
MAKMRVVLVGRCQVRTRRGGEGVVVVVDVVVVGGERGGEGLGRCLKGKVGLVWLVVLVLVVVGVSGVSGVVVSVGVEAGIQIETAVLPCEARQAGRAVWRAG